MQGTCQSADPTLSGHLPLREVAAVFAMAVECLVASTPDRASVTRMLQLHRPCVRSTMAPVQGGRVSKDRGCRVDQYLVQRSSPLRSLPCPMREDDEVIKPLAQAGGAARHAPRRARRSELQRPSQRTRMAHPTTACTRCDPRSTPEPFWSEAVIPTVTSVVFVQPTG